MKFTLEFDMDNAAFENPRSECVRLLKILSDKLAGTSKIAIFSTAIMDSNGNKIGTAEVIED